MVRRHLLCLAALAGTTLALTPAGRADDAGFTKLFNGKDLTGWTTFLEGGANPAKTWTIKDGVIACTGKPAGYLITDKEYGDYVLRVQWRWPDAKKAGNNGVFVHVSGKDQIWPKGVEAQLQSGRAGDFWLVDGFKLNIPKERNDPNSSRHYLREGEAWKTTGRKDKRNRDIYEIEHNRKVEKPLGEWNQYEITCKGDTVTLVVNGTKVNEGTGAEATKGKILLQSEGAPIEFRNIEIKKLK